MRQLIDYSDKCSKLLGLLKEINILRNNLSNSALAKEVDVELENILQLCNIKVELKDPFKEVFAELMDCFVEIKEDLEYIESFVSENFSEDQSDEFLQAVFEILGLVDDVIVEYNGYYSFEKESYVDYEDEVEKIKED